MIINIINIGDLMNNQIDSAAKTSWQSFDSYSPFSLDVFSHYSFDSGMDVVNFSYYSDCDMSLDYKVDQSPVVFAFNLFGSGRGRLLHMGKDLYETESYPHSVFITYSPDSRKIINLFKDQRYHTVTVYLSPESLSHALEGQFGSLPVRFRDLLHGNKNTFFHYAYPMSTRSCSILHQMLNHSFSGRMADMYIECKSLELALHQILEISGDKPIKNRICKYDIDKLHQAKDILLSEYQNPPKITELARRTGINSTKLKNGFKELFEITPHAFIRQKRLENAHKLLHQGHMNITEISHFLGFSDSSHFIREFTKHYGTTPGKFIRNIKY